ncbi:protein of unknown function [Xenorhabdus doucetiae]|uniref:Uncharacterized protein n=1 Tax=Xenorhabdus doucetiae TaxID=351671 RepID=A0A068QXT3_9GAMM|nr:protein of unknown function [Xenorhabdus doucetiae]
MACLIPKEKKSQLFYSILKLRPLSLQGIKNKPESRDMSELSE